MKSIYRFGILTLVVGGSFMSASLAQADPRGGHDRRDNRHNERRYEESRYNSRSLDQYRFNGDQRYVRYYTPQRVIVIDHRDRYVVNNYYRNAHYRPMVGHAKRYLIGAPLPYEVRYEPVPRDLLVQLQPLPYGYRYVRVDNDLLLIQEATRQILDAFSLLS